MLRINGIRLYPYTDHATCRLTSMIGEKRHTNQGQTVDIKLNSIYIVSKKKIK